MSYPDDSTAAGPSLPWRVTHSWTEHRAGHPCPATTATVHPFATEPDARQAAAKLAARSLPDNDVAIAHWNPNTRGWQPAERQTTPVRHLDLVRPLRDALAHHPEVS